MLTRQAGDIAGKNGRCEERQVLQAEVSRLLGAHAAGSTHLEAVLLRRLGADVELLLRRALLLARDAGEVAARRDVVEAAAGGCVGGGVEVRGDGDDPDGAARGACEKERGENKQR